MEDVGKADMPAQEVLSTRDEAEIRRDPRYVDAIAEKQAANEAKQGKGADSKEVRDYRAIELNVGNLLRELKAAKRAEIAKNKADAEYAATIGAVREIDDGEPGERGGEDGSDERGSTEEQLEQGDSDEDDEELSDDDDDADEPSEEAASQMQEELARLRSHGTSNSSNHDVRRQDGDAHARITKVMAREPEDAAASAQLAAIYERAMTEFNITPVGLSALLATDANKPSLGQA